MAITVVLLAAGYATRLHPLTKDRPKALLPIGERLILDEVLRSLEGLLDVRNTVLVTNHRFAEQFRWWQQERGAAVEILDDGTETVDTRLGAICDLEIARSRASADDDLLVLGTDNLFHWSMADFVAAARRYAPAPSVALWSAPSVEVVTQFGVVVRDPGSRITVFAEKSPHPPSKEVALCVYYFPAPMCGRVRQFLDEGGNADAPGYLIEWLVRRGAVYGVLMPGAWHDIGTLETYWAIRDGWRSPR